MQAIFLSFAIGWLIQDPTIIIIRNSLKSTKSIIRTKKYQILEKFVVAPFRTVSFRAFDMFIKQCC